MPTKGNQNFCSPKHIVYDQKNKVSTETHLHYAYGHVRTLLKIAFWYLERTPWWHILNSPPPFLCTVF